MCKCKWPEGVDIRPDGVHSLDPCQYIPVETHRNVDVYVNVCKNCGHVDISWASRPETTHEIFDERASNAIAEDSGCITMNRCLEEDEDGQE